MRTGIRIAHVGGALFSGNISNSGAIKTVTAGGGIVVSGVAVAPGRDLRRQHRQRRGDQCDERFWPEGHAGGQRARRYVRRQHRQQRGDQCDAIGLQIQNVAGNGGRFDGSIINTATISAVHTGIRIVDVGGALFSGNISNSGAIKTVMAVGGIVVSSVANAFGATFAGNIINRGAISAANGLGLRVMRVANDGGTFDGNIVNTAKISAATGIEIEHVGAALFSGNISNSGAITAMTGAGIVVFSIANVTGRTFAGNILNGGTISSLHSGLLVETFKTFTGGIVNSGTINATSGRGIVVAPRHLWQHECQWRHQQSRQNLRRDDRNRSPERCHRLGRHRQ